MLAGDRPPVGTLAVISPYDGRELGTLPTAGADHVNDALDAAYSLFRQRDVWLSTPARISILERVAEIMSGEIEELTILAASEGGKPYTDSKVEVVRAINGIQLCIEGLRGEPGTVIPLGTTVASSGRTAFTVKEPVGVVVAVSAFNHPLNLIVHQVGPAVASGCPVIVKPAADTPLSCIRFVEILREAGLPDEWCQVVIADDRKTSEALVTDHRVGFFSFIGSAGVGWMLRAKLAPGVRCALEHGGAAPLVVVPPVDRNAALASVAKGGFYHAGQVCVSVQRVYVPENEAEGFARELGEMADALIVGAPEDRNTEVGPLIRPREAERVADWVDEAVAAGAVLMSGGRQIDNNCYAPTVLLDPPEDAKVSCNEIFGPVVCVYGYRSVDDAIERANSLPVAFQAAVFSQDIDAAMHVCRRIDASAVMINDHTAFRDDVMPFAGLRESGLGVGGIPYTMEDMQIDKMTVIRSPGI